MNQRRILIVEDDIDLGRNAARTLRASGHYALHVVSPNEARHVLGGDPWDAIVVDLRLHPVRGKGLLEILQERGLADRVYVWTGAPLNETQIETILQRFGVAEVVLKLGLDAGAWLRRIGGGGS